MVNKTQKGIFAAIGSKTPSVNIFTKILQPLIVVMMLQIIVIYGSLIFGGVLVQLESSIIDMFSEKTQGRGLKLENDMTQTWSDLSGPVDAISDKVDEYLKNNSLLPEDIVVTNPKTSPLLVDITSDIIGMLRNNRVTGAFVVFDSGGASSKAGMYLRDSSPGAAVKDDSDISVERGPSSVTKQLGIALSSSWQPDDTSALAEENEYYKPYWAALETKTTNYTDLGYWSRPFYYNAETKNRQVITYSVPLIGASGVVYGVVGIELELEFLKKNLPASEMGRTAMAGYILAIERSESSDTASDKRELEALVKSGTYLNAEFPDWLVLDKVNGHQDLLGIECSDMDFYLSPRPIKLYNTHTYFSGDQWVLLGVSAKSALMEGTIRATNLLLMSLLVTLIIGIVGIFVAARIIARPVSQLADRLRTADPNSPIELGKLNITEIDELSQSVQSLSHQVRDASRKMSRILQNAGIKMGAFEYNKGDDVAFCTEPFLQLMDAPVVVGMGDVFIPVDQLHGYIQVFESNIEEEIDDVTTYLHRFDYNYGHKWVRLRLINEEKRMLGVVTDVTQEILNKQRIEHERDFDLLTNLFNRRAFYVAMNQIFEHPENLKSAALVMMDLDNLKYINDTYGHDYGDKYICASADVLISMASDNIVVTRLSGDEFIMFAYGYDTQAQVMEVVNQLRDKMKAASIKTPTNVIIPVRASAGIAWYNTDSTDYNQLIKYADFAMYTVKHTDRGEVAEFNIETYNKGSYILRCTEELNTILEERKIQFAFQPIVEAKTGKIFAYEALMRPIAENIKSPAELISLARAQSKLAHIERITIQCALEAFVNLEIYSGDCLLFINSLANQMLTAAELEDIEKQYSAALHRVVIELTEQDDAEISYIKAKQGVAKKWGASFALDDFGVGYNGEHYLIELRPEYIKLDAELIRNIDQDMDRRRMIRAIIETCQSLNVKVIGEGVETDREIDVLVELGVDYLQGYAVAKPEIDPPTNILHWK